MVRLVDLQAQHSANIQGKKGTSLVKLVLLRRKSVSQLETVQCLSVPVIYLDISLWNGQELAGSF
jgi:hypothetical protein